MINAGSAVCSCLSLMKLRPTNHMHPVGVEPTRPHWTADFKSASVTNYDTGANGHSRTRTYNPSVNSRMLYHWAMCPFSVLLKLIILMKLTEGSLWWRTDHHSNIMGLSFLAHLQYNTWFIKNQALIFPFISRPKIVSRLALFLRFYTTRPYYPYAT